MPRRARQEGCSGFLHIILRGIGKQILFEEKADYLYFLHLLEKNANECSLKICAYCLMENHVHLLLLDQNHNTSLFVKKTGISYAQYFNQKYQRTGHVFQDRYRSEPVESEGYLRTVFRYILKNPEKAGICSTSQYPWSSYLFYGKKDTFVDTEPLRKYIGDLEDYKAFVSEEEDDQCMEFTPVRLTDEKAKEVLRQMGLESGTVLQSYAKKRRDDVIKSLIQKGLSVRQIERLTGISRGVVQRLSTMVTPWLVS